KNTFPEIKNVIRYRLTGDLVRANKAVYKEDRILYADQNILTSFSFKLLEGNSHNALASTNDIVISQSIAKKYFGDVSAMGKTIEFISDSPLLFKVSGVIQDAPVNSSIEYSFILPIQSDPNYESNLKGHFAASAHLLFVELNKGISATAFE